MVPDTTDMTRTYVRTALSGHDRDNTSDAYDDGGLGYHACEVHGRRRHGLGYHACGGARTSR